MLAYAFPRPLGLGPLKNETQYVSVVRALRRTKENTACYSSCFNHAWTVAQFPSYGSKVVPIPKKSSVKALDNLRPVALISLVMEAIERVVKRHIFTVTDPLMEPLQFAYHPDRGVDDAKTLIMDVVQITSGTHHHHSLTTV